MTHPRRILIIQLRRIGDVIFTLPLIKVLRENFPRAQIDFLVEQPSDQLVRLDPALNETLVYDKRRPVHWLREVRARRYDLVLDFLANGRTWPIAFCSGARSKAAFTGPWRRSLVYNHLARATPNAYLVEQKLDILRSLGLQVGSWGWDIRLPAADTKWAEDFLKEQSVGSARALVALAPASRRETRRWLPARFAEVAQGLLSRGRDVLFLWGPGEKEYIEDIARRAGDAGPGRKVIPPDTPLLRLAALIRSSALVLTVENGPKNLAVALGVPTVNIVGPNNPGSFNPLSDPSHVVLRDESLGCLGCELNACPSHHECMENITPDSVLREIERLLSRPAPASAPAAQGA
ncbi:MAG: glycosyltransferase family 9 protein [Elusimicrobia bacterium]|nr:glycosyltransferase family 9 protein [Elusimicrobiota bacterium]